MIDMSLEDILKEKLGGDVDLSDVMSAVEQEANALVNVKTEGLTKKRDQLLAEVKALKKNQVPSDLDLEGYRSFLEEKENLQIAKVRAEEESLAKAGEWEKLKSSMVKTHREEIDELRNNFSNEINSLQSALDKELIENVAIKAIDKEEGNSTLLLPHIKPYLKTQRDDSGAYNTVVVDKNGEVRFNDKTGDPLSVPDLIAEFKANDSFSGAFPMRNDGSNIPAGKNKSFNGTKNPWKQDNWNVTNQAKISRDNPTLAEQLRKVAGK